MTIDAYGLLVLDDGDGGDSARMEWSYFLANKPIKRWDAYELFNPDMTELVRNPRTEQWWSDPKQTGRDQTLHAFTYLASCITRAGFNAFLWAHVKRGLRCQNGEMLWFNISVITRAINTFYLYPITVLFDLSLVFGAMERCHWLPRWNQDLPGINKFVWLNDPDDVGDDLNLQMSLIQPNHPSPVRWLARKLYVKFRPKVYIYGNPVNNSHACWTWYYRKESLNKHNLAILWAENCRKWL